MYDSDAKGSVSKVMKNCWRYEIHSNHELNKFEKKTKQDKSWNTIQRIELTNDPTINLFQKEIN